MEPLELVDKIERVELARTGSPPVHDLLNVKGSVLRDGCNAP